MLQDAHTNVADISALPGHAIFAVFDGHGGSTVSTYRCLPTRLPAAGASKLPTLSVCHAAPPRHGVLMLLAVRCLATRCALLRYRGLRLAPPPRAALPGRVLA